VITKLPGEIVAIVDPVTGAVDQARVDLVFEARGADVDPLVFGSTIATVTVSTGGIPATRILATFDLFGNSATDPAGVIELVTAAQRAAAAAFDQTQDPAALETLEEATRLVTAAISEAAVAAELAALPSTSTDFVRLRIAQQIENITFENLEPLSTYLGNPCNPRKGGLPFAEYQRRQSQHRKGEIAALLDVPVFIEKAHDIYGYEHFLCDTGGSLCEVINFNDPRDPVASTLSDNTLMLYIRAPQEHIHTLIERFRAAPKPMYYQPEFLKEIWAEYKQEKGIDRDEDVDPDDFSVWGFERLVRHRLPLYEKIASRWGYTVEMEEVQQVRGEEDFNALIAEAITRGNRMRAAN
jgi:hypothetical protein